MQESYDATTLVIELRGHLSHSVVDIERMLRQSTLIPMVMVAVVSEIAAVMQIADNTADTFAIHIAEQ